VTTPWYKRIAEGLTRSREELRGHLNVLLQRGPDLDEEFWTDLEDALIAADMGVTGATELVDRLRDLASREALPDKQAVIDRLVDQVAAEFPEPGADLLAQKPLTVVFVGINGTGKTTTVAKIAKAASTAGRKVVLGSADTYRAAANEQLEVWAARADVPLVARDRGADPASVAFDTLRYAKEGGYDLALIDTAGRLHTAANLMDELRKIDRVVHRESDAAVLTLMVLDATTGQNGIAQARSFDEALGLDGIVLTKLDGTAKGGIAIAIARDLGMPIVRIGVGEGIDDLKPFDPHDFARALVGEK
jgi:fused signal recognition particle receptor